MTQNVAKKAGLGFGMIIVLYILGIFMGAIDTGIVTPARTVIQSGLGVDDKTGIWMINIFTLAYAASIPIAGKLADRLGRKYIYIVCIALFGTGSLICGLSQDFASFPMLLTGRVIQAIGGGGIMPIANAEFGTSFPEEKRGMALGLLGGVYGLANILGSSAGRAILDIFGTSNWQFLFYINLPISVIIVILGIIFLPVHKTTEYKKIDIWGTLILVTMVVSLLYGLKNINFFDFLNTIKSNTVYPFLIAFIVLLPVFILIEKKASDPILNLAYFTNPRILITMIVGAFVGICMMGMIFVPQFSENSLRMRTGSGGYFVTILGLFTGIGAPMSGKLVDKYGPKKVLLGGFAVSLAGSLFLAFIGSQISSLFTVIVSLGLIGTGLGFVMGSPLNYMMLANTKQEEANSALAALSLVRSIGTTIAPAIMIGFLAQAGITAQDNLMNMLPKPSTDAAFIVKAQEFSATVNKLKKDPKVAEMLKNVDIPDLSKIGEMNFDMNSGKALPDSIVKSLQSADVTVISDKTKEMASFMFNDNVPPIIEEIQSGIQKGIDGMGRGITSLEEQVNKMNDGVTGMDKAILEMTKGVDGLTVAVSGMKSGIDKQQEAIDNITKVYNMMTKSQGQIPGNVAMAKSQVQMPSGVAMKGKMPGNIPTNPAELKDQIEKLTLAKKGLETQYTETVAKKTSLEQKLLSTKEQQQQLKTAIAAMNTQKAELVKLLDDMKSFKASVPTAFNNSKNNYLKELDNLKPKIQDSFQSSLNIGFKQMYLTVAVFCILSIIILMFYRKRRPVEQ
jgi:EmrB/QacA subfamily drug resistance transporter